MHFFSQKILIASFFSLLLSSCLLPPHDAFTLPYEKAKHGKLSHRAMQTLTPSITGVSWCAGNAIDTLNNGEEIFPSMLKAIAQAKHSITFESYAVVQGFVLRDFIQALCLKAREGVAIHLLLDAVGAQHFGKKNYELLTSFGIEVRFFHTSWWLPSYNVRDHRKIMIVDGKIGFIGGSGIGDSWQGNAQDCSHWKETHYRLEGPIVAQLQKDFLINWQTVGGKALSGKAYFPPLSPQGSLLAQSFTSSPRKKNYTLAKLYLHLFASAQRSIFIENAYFLLDKRLRKALIAAARRGVKVLVIAPGNCTDAWLLKYLARFDYQQLIDEGIEIYEYRRAMLHSKIMVVDEIFTSIGSGNFDPRSLYINDENNVNVWSSRFAKSQKRLIQKDLKDAERIIQSPVKKTFFHPIGFYGANLLRYQM